MNDGTGSFWNTLQTSEAVVIKMCGKLEKFFMINDLGKKAGPNTGRVLLFHQGWEKGRYQPRASQTISGEGPASSYKASGSSKSQPFVKCHKNK